MQHAKKRLLLISASLFIANLLILLVLPNSYLLYGIILTPILFFVTGPLLIASIISVLLKYNEKDKKHPWQSLLVMVLIIFCILVCI